MTEPEKRVLHRPRKAYESANDTYAFGKELINTGKRLYDWWVERRSYYVTVSENDELFTEAQIWLMSVLPKGRQKSVRLSTGSRMDRELLDDQSVMAVMKTYDSADEVTTEVDGHRVKISIEHPHELAAGRNAMATLKIMFRCDSAAGQDAVIQHLSNLVQNRDRSVRTPKLFLMAPWGNWERRSDLPPRRLNSVILPTGQLESLVDDLDVFLKSEQSHNRRALPWHRGYLLEGPPGTGKTSIAKGLADHFNLDLWYASLGSVERDTDLVEKVASVRGNSILLLEDIDTFHAATQREDQGGLSMSALLNALDGVATPHGLITIMTSNNPDLLDDALVRPGRVDRREHIGYVTAEQTRRLFEYFYEQPLGWDPVLPENTVASTVIEVFKQHTNDPMGAELALRGWSDTERLDMSQREGVE